MHLLFYKQLFSSVGNVNQVSMDFDSKCNFKGSARIHYFSQDHALKAIEEYNEAEIDGKTVKISIRK